MRSIVRFLICAIGVLCMVAGSVAAGGTDSGYSSPDDIAAKIGTIARGNKDIARVNILGQTPGGRDVLLLELGRTGSDLPAIMVVANMEGNYPLASEAALRLSGLLTGAWREELDAHRWYILPAANPDGYARFFASPLAYDCVNDRPFNEDKDDATDEDGPDDLNGDGFITMMRQSHPEGRWLAIADNPVLMKQADRGKGETGTYRLFGEGIDNDGDGEINEDGPGGANPGHNFPHGFEHYTATDGLWAASEPETRAILRFAFDHPEIAMVLVFGQSNTLKKVPESSRKSEATQDKYKLPKWMARELDIDPDQEFAMEELLEMARDFTGRQDIDEEMVLQFLDVGAAVNPDRNDLTYWSEINTRYSDFVKEAGLDGKRLEPKEFPSGSIEEWSYFQYGVPTFSMDFWTLPVVEKKEEKKEEGELTLDEVEKMSNEEFIALGKEKIDAFLKASGAPAQYTADMVIMGLQGGMITTGKMAEMMRKMKKKEEAGGADETDQALYDYNPGAFVPWHVYDHPTLGRVEIGGMIPYSPVAPPLDSVAEVIDKQLPFVRDLAALLPRVSIDTIGLEKRGPDVWKVEVWVANEGFLPYPTYQGKRCQRPAPVSVTLAGEGITVLEGRARKVLGLLAGSGGNEKVDWLVAGAESGRLTVRVHSFSAGTDEQTVTLTGGGK